MRKKQKNYASSISFSIELREIPIKGFMVEKSTSISFVLRNSQHTSGKLIRYASVMTKSMQVKPIAVTTINDD